MDRNPDLDMAEAIIRITSGNVFNRLASTKEEDWDEVDLAKLMKESNALIRATAYKKELKSKPRMLRMQRLKNLKHYCSLPWRRKNLSYTRNLSSI